MKYASEAPNDPVLQEDLERAAAEFSAADELKNRKVMITGATGLVGSMLVRTLACMNRLHELNVSILAQVRSADKAQSVFGELLDRQDISLVIGDVTDLPAFAGDVDYIFHTASITASKMFVTKPVETLMTAFVGTRNVLELAKEKKCRSVVYVSSMEVYGITDPTLEQIHEKDLGYIDILSVRSSYSEGKRACECLCSAYAAEYGVPVKIARLAQTFGAGVSRDDNRVFAQFTKSCMVGEDIVLHTKGESIGNYCYTADAVRGLLTILLKGENGEAYTVVNENTAMPIKQVAQLVSDTLTDGQTQIVFDIPESALTYGYAPDVTLHLSSEKLRALGWKPHIELAEMFRRLAKSFGGKN